MLETRFKTVLDKKTLVLERGLKPNANLDGDMALMIVERNYFQLVEQPKPVVISIVKEFYANIIVQVGHVVMVRGKHWLLTAILSTNSLGSSPRKSTRGIEFQFG